MVVTQPWLRERRLSLGAAAQGQYYLSGVNFGAPPPPGPHFPRPIPQSALRRPRAPPPARSQSPVCASQVPPAAPGPPPMAPWAPPPRWASPRPPLPRPPSSPAAPTTLFRRFCGLLNSAPAAVHMAWAGIRPLDGLGGSRAAPGGPGPARRWVGGVPEAVGTAATVVVGRGAPPLVLFVLVVQ